MMGEYKKGDVFVSGEAGYHTYRIPSIIVSPTGTLLAFCEGRNISSADKSPTDIVLKRSFDNGGSWSPVEVVVNAVPDAAMDPCPVVDKDTGTLWLVFDRYPEHYSGAAGLERNSATAWVTSCRDDGETWTDPVDITATTKKPEWAWIAHGPGVGIQAHSGRLIIPCNQTPSRLNRDGHPSADFRLRGSCFITYSDDHGRNWHLGGEAGPTVSESQVVELADGRLMLNMRSYRGCGCRAVSYSQDDGSSWTAPVDAPDLVEPICQASLLRYSLSPPGDRNRLLFCNPASPSGRKNLTVRLSYDEGENWPVEKQLNAGFSAYSCLTRLPGGGIGCIFETDGSAPAPDSDGRYKRIVFRSFSLEWLTEGKDS